jgi:hypothetical protein
MALTYDESFAENNAGPGFDVDFGVPLTAADLNPVANQNGSSAWTWDSALKSVLGMFDTGVQAYNSVQTAIGQTQVNTAEQRAIISQRKAVLAPATQTPIVMGLNQTQILWAAVALGGVLVISMMNRRA